MAGRLDGKVCVITGTASGIGRESAELFMSEGARVVGVDLSADAAGDLAIQADVTRRGPGAATSTRACATSSGESTSSSTTPASHPTTTARSWTRATRPGGAYRTSTSSSVFFCCKHGIPHLIEAGGGSVINTASFVAVMGAAVSQISYTASKGGVLSLSRELGVEFAREGVRVNALCPGPVNTPLLQELFAKDPAKAQRRYVHLPPGRFAEPREIANGALFLASDESTYVNATTFMVDGGLSGAYLTPE